MASNLQNDFLPADHQQRTKIQKKNRRKKNKNSKNRSSSKATPGRFDFSTLLNDPNIEKLAEQLQDDLPNSRDRKYASTMQQIAENLDFQTMARRLSYALLQDPSMSSMLEIYTNPPIQGRRNLRKLRTRHLNKDPCLKRILDEIENGGPAVMMRYWNDEKVLKMFGLVMGIRPYFADAVASFENYGPDETGDMGNEDSKNSGSDVTEDMESEDESTDHSFSGYVTEEDMENEDESTVHSKNSGSDVTEDMENEDESTVHSKNSGSDVTEDMENEDESTVHSKNSGSDVTEDMENEDESTVHHIAVVDDIELCCWKLEERCQQPRVSPIIIKSQMQIESIHEEHYLLEFMLKLNLLDLLFRRMPREPVPYYWYGYVRAQTRRVKSSLTSAHNLPYQETQQRAGREGLEGLLTILTRVMEATPSVRFAQEFILVLFMYHSFCNVHCFLDFDL